ESDRTAVGFRALKWGSSRTFARNLLSYAHDLVANSRHVHCSSRGYMCVAKTFTEPSDEAGLRDASVRGVASANGWHALEPAVVVTQLGSNQSDGLTTEEVNQIRTHYGSNALQRVRPRPAWRLLVDQFASIVIALLGIAATVAWITGDVLEAIAILIVLVINALVGFATEWQASRAL